MKNESRTGAKPSFNRQLSELLNYMELWNDHFHNSDIHFRLENLKTVVIATEEITFRARWKYQNRENIALIVYEENGEKVQTYFFPSLLALGKNPTMTVLWQMIEYYKRIG